MENARSIGAANDVLRLPANSQPHTNIPVIHAEIAMNALSAVLDPKESSSLAPLPEASIFLLCNI
jgi:hypothetical protein